MLLLNLDTRGIELDQMQTFITQRPTAGQVLSWGVPAVDTAVATSENRPLTKISTPQGRAPVLRGDYWP